MDLTELKKYHETVYLSNPTPETKETIKILGIIERDKSYLDIAMRDLEIITMYEELRKNYKRCESIRKLSEAYCIGFKGIERIISKTSNEQNRLQRNR